MADPIPNRSPDERAADYEPVSEPARLPAKSEVRQKQHQIAVRLDDDDLAALDALCADSGKTRPEVLRLGLTALTIGADRVHV